MSESFKNLKVWKESVLFTTLIYTLTKKYPKEEIFGLVSQLRRAAVSIPANISEGSSRQSKKDYGRFIEIAIGSLNEIETILEISLALGYITRDIYQAAQKDIITLGNLLGGFRNYLKKSSLPTFYSQLSDI
ncbi:MAG: four helix bundle protein [Candidatus Lloydbacteria bacterium]|nr:four helix bundle protein [Candidatus Lloydbacteria bacterium]